MKKLSIILTTILAFTFYVETAYAVLYESGKNGSIRKVYPNKQGVYTSRSYDNIGRIPSTRSYGGVRNYNNTGLPNSRRSTRKDLNPYTARRTNNGGYNLNRR